MAIGRYGVAEQGRGRVEWKEADSCVERVHALFGVRHHEYIGVRLWLEAFARCLGE